ncbi:hypothetical protein Bhyg_03348 [Pseudolycoriella hygida]|uniref:Uncharacterized protein n=1 Tax=Pseudolycoriella hygida TaxID=35572 RepID=A0A9Q0ND61_9DIPT|nr:hypothetical protein Bhyg_03347 [Pseudolycoriella hygida]KAJ6648123.1 hypothetical protein Bhyg_03348 [Pseudolycoriella hygida]
MVEYIRPIYLYDSNTEQGLMSSTKSSTSTVQPMIESTIGLTCCECMLIILGVMIVWKILQQINNRSKIFTYFRRLSENAIELIDVTAADSDESQHHHQVAIS